MRVRQPVRGSREAEIAPRARGFASASRSSPGPALPRLSAGGALHDFSKIPVQSSRAALLPPGEPEADATADTASEEGFEVGDELMLFPNWQIVTLPPDEGPAVLQPVAPGPAPDACNTPLGMRKVTSGTFEGGKTLDDYYPDLVGRDIWGSRDTAGTFDNGTRAGSAVQLIGEYAAPCLAGGSAFTLGQTATIRRARANGARMMEGGRPLEGQTLDDIARSGRDQSRAPFRQEFGFAISMADPISGIPYNTLRSYEFSVDLTSSIRGAGGTRSVSWGITIEASGGRVTRNDLR
jgi:hypothetical protein